MPSAIASLASRFLRQRIARLAALPILLAAGWAQAQAGAELSAEPKKVELCEGRPRLVRVSASNLAPGATARLEWRSDSNAKVELVAAPLGASGPAPQGPWLLQLSATPGAAVVPGTLHLFAGQDPAAPRVPAATVEVAAVPGTASFPLKLELNSSWVSINELQTAVVHATVTNTGRAPVRLQRLDLVVDGSPFQPAEASKGCTPTDRQPVDIPAGEARDWTLCVRVADEAHAAAGKHEILVQAEAAATVEGCAMRSTLLARRDLGFAVLGESAMLTALAIPSFLFVPGFLLLLTPALAWRLGWHPEGREADEQFALNPKTPEFWTLAITLSIAAFYIAPWLGARRDVLVSYRFEDVAWTWLLSLGAGIALHLAVLGRIARAKQRAAKLAAQAAAQQASMTFSEADTPLALLAKMGRKNIGLQLDVAEVQLAAANIAAGGNDKAVGLVVAAADRGRYWICPYVELQLDGLPDALREAASKALRDGSAAALAQAFAQHPALVAWAASPLAHPRSVPEKALRRLQPELMAREKLD